MTIVGTFQAKTHLSELLEKVKEGEDILITKRGEPVARLTSAKQVTKHSLESVKNVFAQIEVHKKDVSLGRKENESLRDLAHEGHKY